AELVNAVRVVAAGEGLLAPSVTRRLIEEFATRPRPSRAQPARLATLTARDRGAPAHRPGTVQCGDRRHAGGGRADRQDARRADPGQARPARPGPGGRVRLRDGPRSTRGLAAKSRRGVTILP